MRRGKHRKKEAQKKYMAKGLARDNKTRKKHKVSPRGQAVKLLDFAEEAAEPKPGV